jgi:hypothetical protein
MCDWFRLQRYKKNFIKYSLYRFLTVFPLKKWRYMQFFPKKKSIKKKNSNLAPEIAH